MVPIRVLDLCITAICRPRTTGICKGQPGRAEIVTPGKGFVAQAEGACGVYSASGSF